MIQLACFIYATLLKFSEMAKFGALDPQYDGLFSDKTAVSPNGQWIAFGEPTYGNVHLFYNLNGSTYSATKTDGTGNTDLYGYAIALSNDVLAIGVPYRDSYGAVDIYNLDETSKAWVLDNDTISCTSCYNNIGQGLSIDGNTMLVGSSAYSTDVIIVLRRTEVGGPWTNVQEIPYYNSYYGSVVSISGNFLAIGSDYNGNHYPMIYQRSSELASFVYKSVALFHGGYVSSVSMSGAFVAYSVGTKVYLVQFLQNSYLLPNFDIDTDTSSPCVVSFSMGNPGILAVGDAGNYVTTYSIAQNYDVVRLKNVEESYCGGTLGHSVSIPSVGYVSYEDMFFVSGDPNCFTVNNNSNSGVGFACSVFDDICDSTLANGLNWEDYDDDLDDTDDDLVDYYDDVVDDVADNYYNDNIDDLVDDNVVDDYADDDSVNGNLGHDSENASNIGAIMGGIFGSIFGVFVVVGAIVLWRKQQTRSTSNGKIEINHGQNMSANSEAMRIEAQLVQQHQEQEKAVSMIPTPGSFQSQYQIFTPPNPMAFVPIAREMVNIPYVVPLDRPPSYKA